MGFFCSSSSSLEESSLLELFWVDAAAAFTGALATTCFLGTVCKTQRKPSYHREMLTQVIPCHGPLFSGEGMAQTFLEMATAFSSSESSLLLLAALPLAALGAARAGVPQGKKQCKGVPRHQRTIKYLLPISSEFRNLSTLLPLEQA